MEISLKNGNCAVETGIPPDQEDSRTEERKKAKPPRPPVTEFRSLVSTTDPIRRSSTPFLPHRNSEHFSEPNVLLFRQLPDTDYLEKCARKAFLRSAEHILATFYAIVFVIQENDWKVLKSEYLPIYFVRVSIKNVKYPFRILVVENEKHRVVDFIVNCNTRTSIKEQAVCWQDQEIFGAKFSTKSQAEQFYDTISRMISTLKKGEQLETENSGQLLDLEVHLPNSEVRRYSFLKNAKLRDTLKYICTKEHLRVNDHYLHHMQLTDDSLNMALTVGDIRANVIRVVSKKELRRSSTDILEKVSKSSSRKSGGILSLFRRRFSRKTKNSRQYSSAPSVLQYTDNIFMVERQSGEKDVDHIDVRDGNNANKPAQSQSPSSSRTTQILAKNGEGLPVNTTTVRRKRKAPRPPSLVIPKVEESSSNRNQVIVNGDSGTEQKKRTKRRAPSPPKHPETIIKPEKNNSEQPNTCNNKPPRPSKPTSLSSSNPTSPIDPEPENLQNQTAINRENKKHLPVFIAPPPPNSTPPPLDECETPVGAIAFELGDEDGIFSVGTNSVVGETDFKNTESCDDEDKIATHNVETEVKIPSTDENVTNGTVEIESKTENANTDPKKSRETIEENVTNEVNVEITKDEVKKEDVSKREKLDENENLSTDDDELRLKENMKNLSPEQLQLLLENSKNPGAAQTQQDPFNFHNQQFLTMQQNQQMLNSILIQQMLQQQVAQQRTTTMMPIQGVGVHPMQSAGGIISTASVGAVHPMQPIGSVISPLHSMQGITHVGGVVPGWGGIHGQPVAQVVNHHPLNAVPLNPIPAVSTIPETSKPFEKLNEVESVDSSLSLISETPTVEAESESSLPEKSKDSSAAAAAKDEELVNRPLFKKMLAQISQGKLKEKESSSGEAETNQVNVTPLVSSNAKIEKVPTSYVTSAEKNVPQTKIVEEKRPPVSLGQIGRKSSYVESAMDRHKIDNEKPTKVEEKKVSFSPGQSVRKPESVNISKDVNKPEGLVQANVTVMHEEISPPVHAEEKKLPLVLDHGTSKPLQVKPTLEEVEIVRNISPPIKAEEKKVPVVLDHSASKPLQVKPTLEEEEIVQKISPPIKAEDKKVPVVLHHSASKPLQVKRTLEEKETVQKISPPIKAEEKNIPVVLHHSASKSLQVKRTLEEKETVQKISPPIKAEEKNIPVAAFNHDTIKSLEVDLALQKTKTIQNISSAIKAEEEKIPVILDHSASKSFHVDPAVTDEAKTVRNIYSPIKAEEKKVSLTPMYNGGQSSSSYNKTDRRKFEVVVPAVRPKPNYQRHMSEPVPATNPKPIVGPKPTAQPIAKSKTLPKSNKQKHIQLSLSLTAEERLEVSKTSGLGTSKNTQTKKPTIYSTTPRKQVVDVKTNQDKISRL